MSLCVCVCVLSSQNLCFNSDYQNNSISGERGKKLLEKHYPFQDMALCFKCVLKGFLIIASVTVYSLYLNIYPSPLTVCVELSLH